MSEKTVTAKVERVPESVWREVGVRARSQGITIRQYMLDAIQEKFQAEDDRAAIAAKMGET